MNNEWWIDELMNDKWWNDKLMNDNWWMMTDDDERTSAAFSTELQILNFIYQDLNKTDNLPETYGEKGINSVMVKEHGKNQYSFIEPDYALEFKGEKLKKYSSKIFILN